MLVYVPLVVAVLLLAIVGLVPLSRRIRRRFNAIAYHLFDRLVDPTDQRSERILRAAGNGTPLRLYATGTYLYSTVAAVSGTVIGIYVGAFVIDVLGIERFRMPVARDIFRPLPDWLLSFDAKYFFVLLVAGIAFGGLIAGIVYVVRWQIPAVRAGTRRRQIDAGLPRTVAFVYALSRGGMAFPGVMRALARNRGVFGSAADEVAVGVRNVELFNDDVVTAMRDLSRRTPSEQFRTFAENLTSVLQSGRDFSAFLREEYERFREAAEEQQREILDLLATTAEIYVTVVVAGMLFLITILLVIGLTSGGMLPLLRLITYVVLPATNLLFIAYLAEITQPLRATREEHHEDGETSVRSGTSVPTGPAAPRGDGSGRLDGDASTAVNRERLGTHRQIGGFFETVGNPVEALVREPSLLLYVTAPVAAVFVLLQLPEAMAGADPIVLAVGEDAVVLPGVDVEAIDDQIVQAVLFVLATFAVVYEVSRRKLERLEGSLPDMLERLASLNEAGVSVVSSFDRVRRSDVGALDEEVDRIWRDIQWGATVAEALDGFESRVRTPAVTRIVTLLTNAMRASNDIGPVLRIAADQARSDLRLKRQRQQEMFTYLVVIYVSFLVFIVVVGAIDSVLIPSLPQSDPAAGTAVPGSGTGVFSVTQNADAYKLVLFHAGLIQATLSGLVGGQMSDGSLKDGVKHASIMLATTYAVFLVLRDVSGSIVAAGILPF
jgi:flagellar protein FlaJ